MNKQELIEHISSTLDKYLKNTTFVKPVLSITEIAKSDEVSLEFEINKNCILLEDNRQELNKPVVPQFVADWIEKCKSEKRRLHESLTYTPFGVNGWVSNPKNQETFARAWLDGYTVEVKRYRVNVKNVRTRQGTLNRSKKSGVFIFSNPEENNLYGTKFTRKELEDAGFGEVFNSPLFEVEEVE